MLASSELLPQLHCPVSQTSPSQSSNDPQYPTKQAHGSVSLCQVGLNNPLTIKKHLDTDPSGLIVLDKLIDLNEVQNILYRGDDNGTYITRHWRTGEIIATAPTSAHIAPQFAQARTHRVPFLNVLLSNVPSGTIQYGREVVDHEISRDGVRLNFADSTSESFDLVVAADGIYSVSHGSPLIGTEAQLL